MRKLLQIEYEVKNFEKIEKQEMIRKIKEKTRKMSKKLADHALKKKKESILLKMIIILSLS